MEEVVPVWSPWPLHLDAVSRALGAHGVSTRPTEEPGAAKGVLVADVVAPDGETLEALLRHRSTAGRATVVWGGTPTGHEVARLRRAGAAAHVSVLAHPERLARVVRDVARDAGPWQATGPVRSPLTARELAVARAYLVDHAHRGGAEVAAELAIGLATLKTHVARIRTKLGPDGSTSRAGLLRALRGRGWL